MRGAAVALVAVALLAGCGGGAGRSGPVPWLDRPLPLYRAPDAKLVHYPASAPPCRASQLRVAQGRFGAGLGNYLNELVFTNTGTTACLLRGTPRVSSDGVPLHPQPGGTYFGQLLAADAKPGAHVFLDLATSAGCRGGRAPAVAHRRLAFALPQGGVVHAPQSVRVVSQCGLSISSFGLPERYTQPAASPGSPGTLRARLAAPRSTSPGATLEYTVTLANPTGRTVRLDPCPGYTQSFYAVVGQVQRTYELNCAPASIPARGSVRYAMRLRVPPAAQLGYAKLGWSLDTPTGPSVGGTIRVEAR